MKDPYKKESRPTEKKEEPPKVYASRVIPLQFAMAGFEFISMLPFIRKMPQEGADIEGILKKRQRVMADIMKEIIELDK